MDNINLITEEKYIMKYKFFSRFIDHSKSYEEFQDYLFFEENYWDDFGFKTLFEVYVPKEGGKIERIGSINIAPPDAPWKYSTFDNFNTQIDYDKLPENFLSIGTTSFYYNLHKYFNKDECRNILSDLNDICLNYKDDIQNIPFDSNVVKESFFRGYSREQAIKKVEYILIPLAEEGKREGYNITYTYTFQDKTLSEINFIADPDSTFPQNVHAIIGNNGSGKTTFIKDILLLAIRQELQVESQFQKDEESFKISFSSNDDIKVDSPKDYFSKVIFISFSPFDSMYLKNGIPIGHNGNVTYLGLYQNGNIPLSFADLYHTFSDLIEKLKNDRDNWLFFREILESQDFHGDILPVINEISAERSDQEVSKVYENVFKKMSAGQKIIVLSLATLITEVEQFNLVLIDEPELFLHPPMISNYIRSISKIMKKKNGLCILTTHSPIIVQEIPKDCIKIIQPNDMEGLLMVEPEYETLGENLSTLTNTIFGLDQYKSGFYLLIKDIIDNPENYGFSQDDIKRLEFGRDGMLYKTLLLSDSNEGEVD